jgi:hypothetical protein
MIPSHLLEQLHYDALIAARQRVLEAEQFGRNAAHCIDFLSGSVTVQNINAGLKEDFEEIREEFQPTEDRKIS